MNSLTRDKGDTKEFRRLVLRSLGKGRRETQKEFRRLVLGEFFLAKGEENKRYSTLLFSRFGKPENFCKGRRRRSSRKGKINNKGRGYSTLCEEVLLKNFDDASKEEKKKKEGLYEPESKRRRLF